MIYPIVAYTLYHKKIMIHAKNGIDAKAQYVTFFSS